MNQASASREEGFRSIFDRQRAASRQRVFHYDERMDALDRLLQAVLARESALCDAVQQDFGRRSRHETRLLEIFPVANEIRHIRRHLGAWMKSRPVRVNRLFLPSKAKVVHQPLGVVGVIGPWNYPVLLTLSPLANALAAGNRVMVKPSERAPATAGIIREMLAAEFPGDHVAVATGGPEVSAAFAGMPFDHLLFTGSTHAGALVAQAAAANLTPVTLELGGKSPALVHESFSTAVAADRICSAKFWSAGQTCVAPDYVLMPAHQIDEFARRAVEAVSRRYPNPESDEDYTWMISQAAYDRMRALIEDAREHGASVISCGGAGDASRHGSRAFAPTIVTGVTDDMQLMQDEIFGPILPVVGYRSLEQAIEAINLRPRPLALYYFDHDSRRADQVIARTVSGGVTVNDAIFHFAQYGLPFGGVGPSGQGAYHGFDGFATFSKRKGVLLQSRLAAAIMAWATKPPYGRWSERLASLLIGNRIAPPR